MWQPQSAAEWVGFWWGVIGGALAVGAALGLIPLVLAHALGQKRLAYVAFFSTLLAGLILGMILALPISIGFVIAILVRRHRAGRSTTAISSQNDQSP